MRSWGSLCKRLTPDHSLPILPEYKTTILSTHTHTNTTHTNTTHTTHTHTHTTHTHTHTHTYTHTHAHTRTQKKTQHTQLLIPEETPLAGDVDFERLARHNMTGGNVRSAVFRAASKAALRPDEERKLTMKVCSAMPLSNI